MNISEQFASSRRLLLVLKRAVRLRIPFEQAFDHISPVEISYRTGLGRKALARFYDRVQRGEEPLTVLPKVASHMLPPALAAMLIFAEKKGCMESLLNEVCPDIKAPGRSPAVQQLGSIYIMLVHGLTLVLLAAVATVILPKLTWCFVGAEVALGRGLRSWRGRGGDGGRVFGWRSIGQTLALSR